MLEQGTENNFMETTEHYQDSSFLAIGQVDSKSGVAFGYESSALLNIPVPLDLRVLLLELVHCNGLLL